MNGIFAIILLAGGLLATTLAGCAKGRAVLLVTVSGPAGAAAIQGVQRLSVSVTNGAGQTFGPQVIALAGAPVAIPPARQFSLSFDNAPGGAVTVVVEALGADGTSLGSGRGSGAAPASQQAELSITLMPFAVQPGQYVLRTSSIGTLGPAAPSSGRYRLSDDGLEYGARACATTLCVTGGIAP